MRAEDILQQIDGALEDWTVSGDAMRSRPGGERGGIKGSTPQTAITDETAGPSVWIAPIGTAIDADGWQEAGYITSVDFEIDQASINPAVLTTPQPTVTWQEIADCIAQIEAGRVRRAQLLEEFVRAFTGSLEAVRPRMEEAGRAIAKSPYGPPRPRR
jgi:hypothetical protein